jgi:DNA-binding transcriptional ArsR family regulator
MDAAKTDAAKAVSALGALAHEHRLGVYLMLVARGPEGLAAGEIAERVGIAPSSLTFHLQQLLHAGLATQRRLGRQLIYAADFAAMSRLVAYLTENCCGDAAGGVPACNPSVPARAPGRRHRRSA